MNTENQKGQALVTFLIFMLIAVSVTTASVAIVLTNTLSASQVEQGTIAYSAGESGAENAMLQLLRNPAYTGETLTVDSATATIQVAGNPPTITSVGTYQSARRTVQVQTVYNSSILTVTSWKEIP